MPGDEEQHAQGTSEEDGAPAVKAPPSPLRGPLSPPVPPSPGLLQSVSPPAHASSLSEDEREQWGLLAVAEEDVARKVRMLGQEASHARARARAAGAVADATIALAAARVHAGVLAWCDECGGEGAIDASLLPRPMCVAPGPDGVPCLLPPAQAAVCRATARLVLGLGLGLGLGVASAAGPAGWKGLSVEARAALEVCALVDESGVEGHGGGYFGGSGRGAGQAGGAAGAAATG